MTFKGNISGRYSSFPAREADTDEHEVIRKHVDYSDPLSVIGAILEEIDCQNYFTRSRVFILAEKVLRSGLPGTSLPELVNFIRFEGAEEFCVRFGKNQDEIPTTPSAPNPIDLHRSATKTDFPPVKATEDPAVTLGRQAVATAATNASSTTRRSQSGLLVANLTQMSQNIAAALQQGADRRPGVLTDEASAPSSRRFSKP